VNSLLQRYVAAVVGFGFVAVWITAGALSALMCLLGSVCFYAAAILAQRRRLSTFTCEFMATAGSGRAHTRRRPPQRRPRRTAKSVDAEDPELALVADHGW
jgi:uncharacterized membrane protein YccC